MRTRFTWLVGIAALILIGFLAACSNKYSSSSSNSGLVVVSAQGNAVMETFSLDLGNGRTAQINNSAGPPTNGVPTSVVLDPAGAFAYVLVTQSTAVNASSTGVEAFPLASDGKLGTGTTTGLNASTTTVTQCNGPGQVPVRVAASGPTVPAAMVIDSSGKFLFVADAVTSGPTQPFQCNGTTQTPTVPIPGAISVFAVSNGTLMEVPGSPFLLPAQTGGPTPSASALAVTPTAFPSAFSICSANVPPTAEDVYVTDSANYQVLNYSVSSTGSLTYVSQNPTGSVPSGVAVDPCNRFVYVSNAIPNNSLSAFAICTAISLPTCPAADYSLLSVTGSPFPAGNDPGPLVVDPLGNHLYVVDRGQNAISAFQISSTTGSLTPLSPPTIATNSFPTSIAIRSDGAWMFVTNLNSLNVSQYAVTPTTGGLTPQPPVQTANNPWGVAVK